MESGFVSDNGVCQKHVNTVDNVTVAIRERQLIACPGVKKSHLTLHYIHIYIIGAVEFISDLYRCIIKVRKKNLSHSPAYFIQQDHSNSNAYRLVKRHLI